MSSGKKLSEQQLFDQLISSLVHSAWVFLGKIKNPVNNQLERDLDQASIQIDMLEMLYNRMKGNLTPNEDQYLNHLVRELKMNFVEEKRKMEDGAGKMEDGSGEMEDGAGKMEDGSGEMEDGIGKKKEVKSKKTERERKTDETEKIKRIDKENNEGKK